MVCFLSGGRLKGFGCFLSAVVFCFRPSPAALIGTRGIDWCIYLSTCHIEFTERTGKESALLKFNYTVGLQIVRCHAPVLRIFFLTGIY